MIEYLKQFAKSFKVTVINEKTIINAIKIIEKYKFSFWDSMIISAALQSNCKILYSEDMHHKQIIENKLTIINPFK